MFGEKVCYQKKGGSDNNLSKRGCEKPRKLMVLGGSGNLVFWDVFAGGGGGFG